MAKDIGEEIVGAWLRVIEGCDFVQYNIPTRTKQGEIDVVGLNLQTQVVYVCEVATHTGGLQYTNLKERQPNNYEKLVQKFSSDIDYAEIYLKPFKKRFMLWSPIVRMPSKENTKHNAFLDLARIQQTIFQHYQIELELVINESYLEKINSLKAKAEVETAASEYPVFRLLQVLGSLERNVTRLKKRGIDSQTTIQALRNGLTSDEI
jgi:Holliday junction resolvase-like predicted endonuclease